MSGEKQAASRRRSAVEELLDPEVLAKASSLALRARIVVDGLVTGLHRSSIRGRDVEFAEHREYSIGDELRHIDWKVYARTNRYYVKRFEQETNAKIQILVDCSRSMLLDLAGRSKLDFARGLAACLSTLLLRQGDAVGLILFDAEIRNRIGAKSHAEHLNTLCEALTGLEAGPDTDIATSLDGVASGMSRRQVIVLISDLIDDPRRVVDAVVHLKHRRHDVTVMQILDPEEIRFRFQGPLRIRDLESGKTLKVDGQRMSTIYRTEVERILERYRLRFHQAGIDYSLVETNQDLSEGLLAFLSRRSRLLGERR